MRKLSATTERMSQSLLDGIIFVTETLTAPAFRSRAGNSVLSSAPGEALLATIDAVSKWQALSKGLCKERVLMQTVLWFWVWCRQAHGRGGSGREEDYRCNRKCRRRGGFEEVREKGFS